MSEENIKRLATLANNPNLRLDYIDNPKLWVKIDRSCFKEINHLHCLWSKFIAICIGSDFAFGNSLFGTVNLTKNADPNRSFHSGYGIGAHRKFSFSNGDGFGTNVIIFGVDDSFSVHADNRKKIP